MDLAKVAFGLVAVLVLVGCSGSPCGTPCDPCAVAPAPDPCAPQPVAEICPPVAPAPCTPAGQVPAQARAGEVWCYVRVPAVTRTVQEQFCVQPATCRQEWVPPVTQDVCEQVCVKPEETRCIPIPARYETVCEQVMVCPAKTEWRKVACEPKSLSEGEQLGECWTLCEIPPVYETRSKQVCVAPESSRSECIPAVYENRTKTITVQEGFYKNIEVPAVYETRCREEVVCPARWEWRRTTECEVPGICPPAAAPGAAPAMPYEAMPAPAPDFGAELPPAGTLPPADPFAR
jgi:hypothetical protein